MPAPVSSRRGRSRHLRVHRLQHLAGTNDLQIFVCGNDEQVMLASRLDNLGKGASGAAVQNMNIMLGLDEGTGLTAKE